MASRLPGRRAPNTRSWLRNNRHGGFPDAGVTRLDPLLPDERRAVQGGLLVRATRARFSPWALSARAPLAGTRHLIPETERAGSQETVVSCTEQVAADPDQILDNTVHRCEPLQMGGRLEPSHLPLALTRRLMRDLRSVVFVRPSTVDHGRHHGAVRRRVAAQPVRDQPARLAALSLPERAAEPCGRPPIAPRRHQDVAHMAVLVHGPPQILLPPPDLDEQRVQMPGVALTAPPAP